MLIVDLIYSYLLDFSYEKLYTNSVKEMICFILYSLHTKKRDIGKVSSIFEFFPSGFVFGLGLALYLVGLYAELDSASNGSNFN